MIYIGLSINKNINIRPIYMRPRTRHLLKSSAIVSKYMMILKYA